MKHSNEKGFLRGSAANLVLICCVVVVGAMFLANLNKKTPEPIKVIAAQTDPTLMSYDERAHELLMKILQEEREKRVAATIKLMMDIGEAQDRYFEKLGVLATSFDELVKRSYLLMLPSNTIGTNGEIVTNGYYIKIVGTPKRIQLFANNPAEGAGFVIYTLVKEVGKPYKLCRITENPQKPLDLVYTDITSEYKTDNQKGK